MRQIVGAFLALLACVAPAYANPAATRAINDVRASASEPALVYSSALERAAQVHADDMAAVGFFSHEGSKGAAVSDRVTAQSYEWCFVAENIAKGQMNLAEVMKGWTGSPGHYRNMTHKAAQEFGLARASGNVWVMVLAAPC